jgi:DNA processing protein
MDERVAAVATLLTVGHGTDYALNVARYLPSFSKYAALCSSNPDPEDLKKRNLVMLSSSKIKEAERICRECNEKNITVISFFDPAYPNNLKQIEDPPIVLFTRGLPIPDFDSTPSITMVGTRDAKKEYLKYAAINAFSFAVLGFTVVSGFTTGIDSYSLKGALFAGGKTVSVFPCGVDVTPGHIDRTLEAVLLKYGTILSEYPPRTPVRAWQYARRNRILSGLTQSTLVVEAGIESGAMSTAEYALDQGRTVYAVPDGPYEPRSEGSNFLLRNGGVLASSFLDIVADYNQKYGYDINPEAHRERLAKGFNSAPSIIIPKEIEEGVPKQKKSISKNEKAEKPEKKTKSSEKEISSVSRSPLEDNEKQALEILRASDVTADSLCDALGWGFLESVETLASLVNKGYATEGAGGIYVICK